MDEADLYEQYQGFPDDPDGLSVVSLEDVVSEITSKLGLGGVERGMLFGPKGKRSCCRNRAFFGGNCHG